MRNNSRKGKDNDQRFRVAGISPTTVTVRDSHTGLITSFFGLELAKYSVRLMNDDPEIADKFRWRSND